MVCCLRQTVCVFGADVEVRVSYVTDTSGVWTGLVYRLFIPSCLVKEEIIKCFGNQSENAWYQFLTMIFSHDQFLPKHRFPSDPRANNRHGGRNL